MTEIDEAPRTAGFGVRLGATFIDGIMSLILCLPVTFPVISQNASFNMALTSKLSWLWAFIIISFWYFKGATPGKIVFGLKLIDSRTGNKLSLVQCLVRYVGQFVSSVPFGLGYLWIIKSKRNQGWHDSLANTLVVRTEGQGSLLKPALVSSLCFVISMGYLAIFLKNLIRTNRPLPSVSQSSSDPVSYSVQSAGVRVGEKTTESECFATALQKAIASTSLKEDLGSNTYLSKCLTEAPRTIEFCQDVPSFRDKIKSEEWAESQCQLTGNAKANCKLLCVTVQFHCL